MEQEYETIDLREILFLIKNNLLAIVASTVICALLGFIVTTFLITPQYEASATMIVNSRQEQTANLTNDMITTAKNLVATYSIIVKSDTVLDEVIGQLGLELSYEQLEKKVTVSAVDSTQVMKIAVEDENPAQAKAIAEAITRIAPPIIQDKVEAGSVKVISEARAGEKPVSPNKRMNTAIAGLLGLVLSVGAVFLREMLNNTFKTDEDIQKYLGFTVLGVIPHVEMEG